MSEEDTERKGGGDKKNDEEEENQEEVDKGKETLHWNSHTRRMKSGWLNLLLASFASMHDNKMVQVQDYLQTGEKPHMPIGTTSELMKVLPH